MTDVVVEFRRVAKHYGGLRPLRIERLTVSAGQQIALTGFDQPMAETFVNLVTGAILPDAGDITIFGRSTAAIENSTDWLSLVDRFGIVSERAALLEGMSVVQNLAMPFSLEIDPLPESLRASAVAVGTEVGLGDEDWDNPMGTVDAVRRLRVRLARALALRPSVVLLEHPTVRLRDEDRAALGRAIHGIIGRCGAAAVTLTADREFAGAASSDLFALEPATGRLRGRFRLWRP